MLEAVEGRVRDEPADHREAAVAATACFLRLQRDPHVEHLIEMKPPEPTRRDGGYHVVMCADLRRASDQVRVGTK